MNEIFLHTLDSQRQECIPCTVGHNAQIKAELIRVFFFRVYVLTMFLLSFFLLPYSVILLDCGLFFTSPFRCICNPVFIWCTFYLPVDRGRIQCWQQMSITLKYLMRWHHEARDSVTLQSSIRPHLSCTKMVSIFPFFSCMCWFQHEICSHFIEGVLLHYEDAALRDLYFLDPQWLCDMLAHVVTIREINPFAKNGLFSCSHLTMLMWFCCVFYPIH